jgi:hypothetical protein
VVFPWSRWSSLVEAQRSLEASQTNSENFRPIPSRPRVHVRKTCAPISVRLFWLSGADGSGCRLPLYQDFECSFEMTLWAQTLTSLIGKLLAEGGLQCRPRGRRKLDRATSLLPISTIENQVEPTWNQYRSGAPSDLNRPWLFPRSYKYARTSFIPFSPHRFLLPNPPSSPH